MKTNKNIRSAGFTLVEIMIVVAIIGLLAAIAIPNFVKARATSQANACINNLRQIDGAIQQWALENQAGAATTVTAATKAPLTFEVTYPKEMSAAPLDGHILLLISNDPFRGVRVEKGKLILPKAPDWD